MWELYSDNEFGLSGFIFEQRRHINKFVRITITSENYDDIVNELSQMMLACSLPPMQEEQDEIPEKDHFVRNRLELGVCRYLEKRCTYDRKKGFSHQLGYNKAMGLLSAVSMRMQAN